MEIILEEKQSNHESKPIVFVNKKSLKVIKNKQNNYSILYNVKNNNIYLPKIINFNTIQLVYEINRDFFDDCNIKIINENEKEGEAVIYMLVKPFFKDLGILRRYAYLKAKIFKTDDKIHFEIKNNYNEPPKSLNIPDDAYLLPLDDMGISFDIIDQHNVNARHDIHFSASFEIPEFIEKLALPIFGKIFTRTKQFIENIQV